METKPKASLGRVVILKGWMVNGTDEHPARITRVWGELPGHDMVNLMVDFDGDGCRPLTSVYLYANRQDAEESGFRPVAFWPDRA